MLARRELIEAEVLALQRDFDALWARVADHAPGFGKADLRVLQRALDAGQIDLGTERERRSLGIALGMVLAHELTLHWVRLADDWGVEMALTSDDARNQSAHPLPMIATRADEGRGIDLLALFDSVARLFGAANADDVLIENAAAWRATFDHPGPGLDALEQRLGDLASTLQVTADLSYVMIRGTGFSIQVDSGRGNAADMTMQVSFAGERAMLAVSGRGAHELGDAGSCRDLHLHTRQAIERAIDEHLAAHLESAANFAPFTEGVGEEPFPEPDSWTTPPE